MAEDQNVRLSEAIARVVAQARSDDGFKARLLADPRAVLTAAGVPLQPGVAVKIVEDTDTLMHIVLPARPAGQLSEEQLAQMSGGLLSGGGLGANTWLKA